MYRQETLENEAIYMNKLYSVEASLNNSIGLNRIKKYGGRIASIQALGFKASQMGRQFPAGSAANAHHFKRSAGLNATEHKLKKQIGTQSKGSISSGRLMKETGKFGVRSELKPTDFSTQARARRRSLVAGTSKKLDDALEKYSGTTYGSGYARPHFNSTRADAAGRYNIRMNRALSSKESM